MLQLVFNILPKNATAQMDLDGTFCNWNSGLRDETFNTSFGAFVVLLKRTYEIKRKRYILTK